MPTKASERNYQREYAEEGPERRKARAARNRARYHYEKDHGNLPTDMHVDHKRPISQGGGNDKGNLRALPKKANESFNRAGPGGKQVGSARGKRK